MLGFIIAVVAGFLTPHADGPLTGPIVARAAPFIRIEPTEQRLISFMILMLICGFLAAILDSGSAFWIIFGGSVGYFATRIFDSGKRVMDDRRAKTQSDAVNWKR